MIEVKGGVDEYDWQIIDLVEIPHIANGKRKDTKHKFFIFLSVAYKVPRMTLTYPNSPSHPQTH